MLFWLFASLVRLGARIWTKRPVMISDKLTLGVLAVVVLLLISVVLGFAIAGLLRLWHKYKPVKEADVQNDKRPLGLE